MNSIFKETVVRFWEEDKVIVIIAITPVKFVCTVFDHTKTKRRTNDDRTAMETFRISFIVALQYSEKENWIIIPCDKSKNSPVWKRMVKISLIKHTKRLSDNQRIWSCYRWKVVRTIWFSNCILKFRTHILFLLLL